MTLYVRGLTEETKHILGGAAFLLLDGALGGYVVETAVGFIDWHPLPEDPQGAGLKSLRRIREVFDTVVQ